MTRWKTTVKYRNRKTEVDGIVFDSKLEAKRYAELKLLEKAKEIFDLKLQPNFPLDVNGETVCWYRADFQYATKTGELVIEDAKGFKTPVYRLKKRLFEAIHRWKITEIRK